MKPNDHPARILVAGIGNIFLGDDAFGVEVATRLAAESLPDGVRLVDIGTRSLHLAYELLETEYDLAILIDAVARGGAPGTLYVIEPEPAGNGGNGVPVDAHGVRPEHALTMLRTLGGRVESVRIVGCEPGRIGEEPGLSAPVAAAVPEAIRIVLRLVEEHSRHSDPARAG
jgi:hydrogenase maturation protease